MEVREKELKIAVRAANELITGLRERGCKFEVFTEEWTWLIDRDNLISGSYSDEDVYFHIFLLMKTRLKCASPTLAPLYKKMAVRYMLKCQRCW